MKTGDYARLNCTAYDTVVILKIMEIFENTILTENDGSMYEGEYSKEEIIKSSPNIIDLIEVGDYVDKLRVVDKYENYIVVETFDERIVIQKQDIIKSIVTKEQFESMQYEVK